VPGCCSTPHSNAPRRSRHGYDARALSEISREPQRC
jgi:hypothetical protein